MEKGDFNNGSTTLTLFNQQNLDSSKLKEYADDYFKFDQNTRKFSKQIENSVGKGEIDNQTNKLSYYDIRHTSGDQTLGLQAFCTPSFLT